MCWTVAPRSQRTRKIFRTIVIFLCKSSWFVSKCVYYKWLRLIFDRGKNEGYLNIENYIHGDLL